MRALTILIAAAALIGCGGGPSDEQQVRDTAKQLAEHGRESRWGDFCALTTDPDGCMEALAALEAAGVDAAEFIPSDELADKMTVRVEGDRATVDGTEGEDAVYLRRGGDWLYVWEQ